MMYSAAALTTFKLSLYSVSQRASSSFSLLQQGGGARHVRQRAERCGERRGAASVMQQTHVRCIPAHLTQAGSPSTITPTSASMSVSVKARARQREACIVRAAGVAAAAAAGCHRPSTALHDAAAAAAGCAAKC